MINVKMSTHLPVSRIKTIMKSSSDVETVSKESLQLVTFATELFIKHLAKRAEKASKGRDIEYRHLSEVVSTSERYDFLTEIIPRKITVREFKEMLREKQNNSSDDSYSGSDHSNSSYSSRSGSDDTSASDDNSSTHSK